MEATVTDRRWVEDTSRPGRLRWWDGAAYSGDVVYAAVLQRHLRVAQVCAVALTVLVAVVGWLYVVSIRAHLDLVHAVSSPAFLEQPYHDEKLDALITRTDLVRLESASLMVVTAVVLAAWHFRLASLVPTRELRRQPEWHAGAWFVPLVNLVAPILNLSAVWRGLRTGRHARLPLVAWLWWAAWLVSFALWMYCFPALFVVRSEEGTLQVFRLVVVGKVAGVAAAVGAVLVVGLFTRRARRFVDRSGALGD